MIENYEPIKHEPYFQQGQSWSEPENFVHTFANNCSIAEISYIEHIKHLPEFIQWALDQGTNWQIDTLVWTGMKQAQAKECKQVRAAGFKKLMEFKSCHPPHYPLVMYVYKRDEAHVA